MFEFELLKKEAIIAKLFLFCNRIQFVCPEKHEYNLTYVTSTCG